MPSHERADAREDGFEMAAAFGYCVVCDRARKRFTMTKIRLVEILRTRAEVAATQSGSRELRTLANEIEAGDLW